MPKDIKCPVCNVELEWKELSGNNNFRGNCPKCGMGFSYMNGTVISDPKFSRK